MREVLADFFPNSFVPCRAGANLTFLNIFFSTFPHILAFMSSKGSGDRAVFP